MQTNNLSHKIYISYNSEIYSDKSIDNIYDSPFSLMKFSLMN